MAILPPVPDIKQPKTGLNKLVFFLLVVFTTLLAFIFFKGIKIELVHKFDKNTNEIIHRHKGTSYEGIELNLRNKNY